MTQFLIADTRTIPTVAHVPADHLIKWIDNIDTGPRLGPGEFALIDTGDTMPAHGELYLIRWRSSGTEIVQALCRQASGTDGPTWWTRGVYSIDRRGRIDIPGNRYVDGPRCAEQFRRALIGRVIGIYRAAKAEQVRRA